MSPLPSAVAGGDRASGSRGPDGMPTSGARVLVAFLAGRTAYGLAYLAGSARDLPIPWYRPLERAYHFGSRPPFFAMEWYGRSLTSALIATLVTALLWSLSARRPLNSALRSPAWVRSVAQAAALALLVDFTYFGWIFLTQPAIPLPLPPGCLP